MSPAAIDSTLFAASHAGVRPPAGGGAALSVPAGRGTGDRCHVAALDAALINEADEVDGAILGNDVFFEFG